MWVTCRSPGPADVHGPCPSRSRHRSAPDRDSGRREGRLPPLVRDQLRARRRREHLKRTAGLRPRPSPDATTVAPVHHEASARAGAERARQGRRRPTGNGTCSGAVSSSAVRSGWAGVQWTSAPSIGWSGVLLTRVGRCGSGQLWARRSERHYGQPRGHGSAGRWSTATTSVPGRSTTRPRAGWSQPVAHSPTTT